MKNTLKWTVISFILMLLVASALNITLNMSKTYKLTINIDGEEGREAIAVFQVDNETISENITLPTSLDFECRTFKFDIAPKVYDPGKTISAMVFVNGETRLSVASAGIEGEVNLDAEHFLYSLLRFSEVSTIARSTSMSTSKIETMIDENK